MVVSRLWLCGANNKWNENLFVHRLTYDCQCTSHSSINIFPLSLITTRHLAGQATIDSAAIQPTEVSTVTRTSVMSSRVLTELVTILSRVPGKLRKGQRFYKRYFDQNIQTGPKLSVALYTYVECPPLIISITDSIFGKIQQITAASIWPV